jgi:hypothetical protein
MLSEISTSSVYKDPPTQLLNEHMRLTPAHILSFYLSFSLALCVALSLFSLSLTLSLSLLLSFSLFTSVSVYLLLSLNLVLFSLFSLFPSFIFLYHFLSLAHIWLSRHCEQQQPVSDAKDRQTLMFSFIPLNGKSRQ